MTGDESQAFDALEAGDRSLLSKFATAKAELDQAVRGEARAESDLERARERRLKASEAFKAAAAALSPLLPSEPKEASS